MSCTMSALVCFSSDNALIPSVLSAFQIVGWCSELHLDHSFALGMCCCPYVPGAVNFFCACRNKWNRE